MAFIKRTVYNLSKKKVTQNDLNKQAQLLQNLKDEQSRLEDRLSRGVYDQNVNDLTLARQFMRSKKSFQKVADYVTKWNKVKSKSTLVNRERRNAIDAFLQQAKQLQKRYDDVVVDRVEKRSMCEYFGSEEECKKRDMCYWFGTAGVRGKNVGCYPKGAKPKGWGASRKAAKSRMASLATIAEEAGGGASKASSGGRRRRKRKRKTKRRKKTRRRRKHRRTRRRRKSRRV